MSFQTGDIVFVLLGVFFSRYVLLRSPSSDEKTAVKSETHYRKEASKVWLGKVFKENSIIGRSWSSEKLFLMWNYTDNADGDVPLIVENAWYF